jgi:hypothetical protein
MPTLFHAVNSDKKHATSRAWRRIFYPIAATIGSQPLWSAELGSSLELSAKLIPLAPGGFQVKRQIFHVEPELAQGVLHQNQYPAPTPVAIDNPGEVWLDRLEVFGGQSVDGFGQIGQFAGNFVGADDACAGGRLAHGSDLLQGCGCQGRKARGVPVFCENRKNAVSAFLTACCVFFAFFSRKSHDDKPPRLI